MASEEVTHERVRHDAGPRRLVGRDPVVEIRSCVRVGLEDRPHDRIVERVVDRAIDSIVANGEAELRRELAGPVAVGVVGAALGLDDVEPARLLGWYDAIVGAVDAISRGRQVEAGARTAFDELSGVVDAAAGRSGTLVNAAAGTLDATEIRSNAAVLVSVMIADGSYSAACETFMREAASSTALTILW